MADGGGSGKNREEQRHTEMMDAMHKLNELMGTLITSVQEVKGSIMDLTAAVTGRTATESWAMLLTPPQRVELLRFAKQLPLARMYRCGGQFSVLVLPAGAYWPSHRSRAMLVTPTMARFCKAALDELPVGLGLTTHPDFVDLLQGQPVAVDTSAAEAEDGGLSKEALAALIAHTDNPMLPLPAGFVLTGTPKPLTPGTRSLPSNVQLRFKFEGNSGTGKSATCEVLLYWVVGLGFHVAYESKRALGEGARLVFCGGALADNLAPGNNAACDFLFDDGVGPSILCREGGWRPSGRDVSPRPVTPDDAPAARVGPGHDLGRVCRPHGPGWDEPAACAEESAQRGDVAADRSRGGVQDEQGGPRPQVPDAASRAVARRLVVGHLHRRGRADVCAAWAAVDVAGHVRGRASRAAPHWQAGVHHDHQRAVQRDDERGASVVVPV
jgi:hypothetical protein